MDAERECHPLFVPVHASQSGTLALRTGRLASGQRIGLAFSSEASLLSALGLRQQWIRLGEQALRDMLTPLGVDHMRVDPHLAREVAHGAPEGAEREGAQASGTAQRPVCGSKRRAGLPRRAERLPPMQPSPKGPPDIHGHARATAGPNDRSLRALNGPPRQDVHLGAGG